MVWLLSERAADRVLVTAWLATGSASPPHQVCPPWHSNHDEEEAMFVIGIDPHRGSHAAAALDSQEHLQGELQLSADRRQRQQLLAWASDFTPRVWAVEGATGTGALLAQQLVAAGEQVLDVPPKLAARVRLLDNNHSDKTDRHDARSAAIVALRNSRLRRVSVDDHGAVLRLLAKRHHDLIAARTRAICRLHTTVTFLVEGTYPAVYEPIVPPASWLASTRRPRSPSNARRWHGTCSPRSGGSIVSSPPTANASAPPSPPPTRR